MIGLCVGAFLAGSVAASLLPFLPFACGVLAALASGVAWALVGGTTLVQVALSSAALVFACQIGYGVGLVLAALVGRSAAVRRRALAASFSRVPAAAKRQRAALKSRG